MKNHLLNEPEQYIVKDNGIFPNSTLPVLLYKKALSLPLLFPSKFVINLFKENKWGNNWKNGIYTYQHYHSTTHEVLGVIKGQTTLQLGGDNGIELIIEKGDVLVIPAGVAHKNLGKKNDVICVAGYPGDRDYDMNNGEKGERPRADENIKNLALPVTDPIYGSNAGLVKIWSQATGHKKATVLSP